jgi:hypothetical protein
MSSLVDEFGESEEEYSLPNSDEESGNDQFNKTPQGSNPFLRQTQDQKKVDVLATVSQSVQEKYVSEEESGRQTQHQKKVDALATVSQPVQEKYVSEEESV